jgi:hypothetical protein
MKDQSTSESREYKKGKLARRKLYVFDLLEFEKLDLDPAIILSSIRMAGWCESSSRMGIECWRLRCSDMSVKTVRNELK